MPPHRSLVLRCRGEGEVGEVRATPALQLEKGPLLGRVDLGLFFRHATIGQNARHAVGMLAARLGAVGLVHEAPQDRDRQDDHAVFGAAEKLSDGPDEARMDVDGVAAHARRPIALL